MAGKEAREFQTCTLYQRCSPSALLRQIEGFHEGRISGSSQPQGAKMKQKSGPGKAPAEQVLKDIRRQTRRHFSAEEKIRIVLEGLRGEENISELCRREGIAASIAWQETRPVPRLSARSTLSN